MSKLKIEYPTGSTPIDLDEVGDLIPDYLTTVQELNSVEQSNIADGYLWAERQNLDELLTATFVLTLHKRMFDQVWRWAGKARKSNKNIGVMKEQIMTSLGQLLGDTNYWIENQTYSPDEIGVRFHHLLVKIHAFPNGNGRHARLMTDLLLMKMGVQKFSWGITEASSPLEVEGKTRSDYIAALRAADAGEYALLLEFVRR